MATFNESRQNWMEANSRHNQFMEAQRQAAMLEALASPQRATIPSSPQRKKVKKKKDKPAGLFGNGQLGYEDLIKQTLSQPAKTPPAITGNITSKEDEQELNRLASKYSTKEQETPNPWLASPYSSDTYKQAQIGGGESFVDLSDRLPQFGEQSLRPNSSTYQGSRNYPQIPRSKEDAASSKELIESVSDFSKSPYDSETYKQANIGGSNVGNLSLSAPEIPVAGSPKNASTYGVKSQTQGGYKYGTQPGDYKGYSGDLPKRLLQSGKNLYNQAGNIAGLVNTVNPLAWGIDTARNFDSGEGLLSAVGDATGDRVDAAIPGAKDVARATVDVADFTGDILLGTNRKEGSSLISEKVENPMTQTDLYQTEMGQIAPVQSALDLVKADMEASKAQWLESQKSWVTDKFLKDDTLLKSMGKEDFLNEISKHKDLFSPEEVTQITQSVEESSKPKIPGVSNPVVSEEVSTAETHRKNREKGVGDEDGVVSAPTNSSENPLKSAANAVINQSTTPVNWYESKSFNRGLMSFGMALLSGASWYDAFAAGAKDYDDNISSERRQQYYDELVGDGYSPQQVMEWVEKGDASILSKETYTTGKDQYGTYQMNEVTGKKDYFTPTKGETTWKEATRDVGGQTLYGQENNLGEFKPYNKDFQGDGLGGGNVKAPNESQAKATFGYNRAQAANNVWNERHYGSSEEYALATKTGNIYVGLGDESGAKLAIGTMSPKYQQAAAEERTFLAGVLRPESGAAVSNSEWTNYGHIFFPRLGDDPRKHAQKAWLRDMTTMALAESGVTFTTENEKEEASKIINAMISQAGDVVEYNPNEGVVKLADGTWYELQVPNRSY